MQNEKKVPKKLKRVSGSVFLYVAASVVAIIAIALLINNILIYKNIINQYIAQGYDPAEVTKQLLPSQLLPGIFQPVAVYGGIAVLLIGVGMVYQKVAKFTAMLATGEVENNETEDTVLQESSVEMEDTEVTEQVEENGDSI